MTINNESELLFHQELLKLSKEKSIDGGHLDEGLRAIVRSISAALKVERVSVWFYNEDQTSIICQVLIESTPSTYTSGYELKAQDFPAYFKYLAEERTLPANDAQIDPATYEFTEIYLKPLNIVSMMDAPIRVDGKMIGVVCCEQVALRREWTLAEETFVGNITDIIARGVQAKERLKFQTQLEIMNRELEGLVNKRTAELEEQRSRSEFSSKMALLGEMAGSMAHEINNPLAIILSSIHNFKKMEQKGTLTLKSAGEILEDIETTTKRIDKIVRGLRFFARDATLDEMTVVNLQQILDDTLSLCHEKIIDHDCRIELINDFPEININCQAVSISQSLLNLVNNAFDAISDLDQKWIKIQIENHGKFVWVKVTDSGKGISKEIREKILMPFFTTKPTGKGTGLGLSIVKGIINQHGGALTLDEESENTCFIIKLPKSDPEL